MDGMIIGMMKRKIEKYKEITRKLIKKENLSEEEQGFLKKEKIIE